MVFCDNEQASAASVTENNLPPDSTVFAVSLMLRTLEDALTGVQHPPPPLVGLFCTDECRSPALVVVEGERRGQ